MQIKNRGLFRITRFILLYGPYLFRFFALFRRPKKRLLIIKTDAIGDYVLFRNFIEIVKNSEVFGGYDIDLVGNGIWQNLAIKYDSDFVSNFFSISPDELYEAPWQTLKSGWRLFKRNYGIVLQPIYARTFMGDGIAALTAAKEIVGFAGDTERINLKYKVKTDRFYTRLLQLTVDCQFEFDRSKFFFERILREKIAITGPSIKVESGLKKSILIFPGARVAKRSWEAEKFIELIKLLRATTIEQICLAGGPGDTSIGNYLIKNLPPDSVINLIGTTSVTDMVELIGNAALVISNESAPIHIAAAVNTKAICVLGGGHFGRFAPYPESMQTLASCVFEKMDCFNCNWQCIYKTAQNEPFPCVLAISVKKVWGVVNTALHAGDNLTRRQSLQTVEAAS